MAEGSVLPLSSSRGVLTTCCDRPGEPVLLESGDTRAKPAPRLGRTGAYLLSSRPAPSLLNRHSTWGQETDMSSMTTCSIVFACVFGGALLGTLLRKILPDDHLSSDSKDV